MATTTPPDHAGCGVLATGRPVSIPALIGWPRDTVPITTTLGIGDGKPVPVNRPKFLLSCRRGTTRFLSVLFSADPRLSTHLNRCYSRSEEHLIATAKSLLDLGLRSIVSMHRVCAGTQYS